MRDVSYWPGADRLVYVDASATPEFWDRRWREEGPPPPVSPNDEVRVVTPKYLQPGARVLEGGCGRGHKVKALADAGFDATGIDFAEETVNQCQRHFPDIDVRRGDVRKLEFADNYFDGYWSIGVIEHFWDGYDSILSEAARVLKPGGFLFLTAPWFSPLRKRAVRVGKIPAVERDTEPSDFYQFALGRNEVVGRLTAHGFDVHEWIGLASAITLVEDVDVFKSAIEWLFSSRGSILKRAARKAATELLNPYAGHSFLAVARRRHQPDEKTSALA